MTHRLRMSLPALLATVLLSSFVAGAQEETEPSLEDIVIHDSVELDLQQVYATVTDRRGRRVLGLAQADFRLEDSGTRQEIVTLGGGELPFTAVVLVDSSLSMEGPALDAAWDGLRSFLGGMRSLDEARVLLFADVLLWSSSFSQDPASLAVDPAAFGDLAGTSILDHLYLGTRLLETRHGRPVIILLSDGVDVHSILDLELVERAFRRSPAALYWVRLQGDDAPPPKPQDAGARPAEDRWDSIQATRELIWLTSFRPPTETNRIQRTLTKIVRDSGGRTVDVRRREEIAPALEEILQELREQYALGFYPESDDGEGWRELSIEVPGKGLQVRYRRGYFP